MLAQNPLFPGIPGRVIVRAKRFPSPNGASREHSWTREISQEDSGPIVTREIAVALDDGTCPEDEHDVFRCRCEKLVCLSQSTASCQGCAHRFCRWCLDNQMCARCAYLERTSKVVQFFNKTVWGI